MYSCSILLINSVWKLPAAIETQNLYTPNNNNCSNSASNKNVNMAKRSRRTSIKINDKQKIIEEIASGSKITDVAIKYGISRSCASKIYKKKDDIAFFRKFVTDIHLQKIHNVRLPINLNLEDVVYLWFCQQRSWGQSISGPLLCEKALYINKTLGGPASFKASNGWLEKFKQRHGIRQLSTQAEKSFCNFEEIQIFLKQFQSFITNHAYTLQNIYNADETGLNWKTLPGTTLAVEYELPAPGFKVSKERLTAMMCANANGTHRLPILIIGKYKKPKCMEDVNYLPVVYKAQKDAWMDKTLFLDWYTNTFIKWVLQKQTEEGRNEKVLLILDNAPCHPSEDQLNSIHENFKVMFLPPNVTAVLQPMNQGIIEQTKKIYKKNMLRFLLMGTLKQTEFLEQLTILDCCNMIADAWNNVLINNLRKAWENLLPIENATDSTSSDHCDNFDSFLNQVPNEICTQDELWFNTDVKNEGWKLHSFFNQVPNEICTQDELDLWFNTDAKNEGWKLQTIDDIINDLQNKENYKHESAEEEEPKQNNNYTLNKLSKEIIQAVHTFKNWSQYQKECTKTDFESITKMLSVAEKQLDDNNAGASISHENEKADIVIKHNVSYMSNDSNNSNIFLDSQYADNIQEEINIKKEIE